MKKIKEFLKEHGYSLEFIGTYSQKQYRSRYTCLEDEYKVTKDNKTYKLTVKITGNKLYMMHEGNRLVAGGTSQIQVIEMLKREENK